MQKLSTVLTVFLSLFLATDLPSQAIAQKDVVEAWNIASKMVIESAKLMPAEQYSFSPGEPLRSFANQINHTTASNIMFAASVNAGQPDFAIPDRKNPPQEKEAVIALLEKSFNYFGKGLASLNDAQLAEEVPWGRGGKSKVTRLKAILIVLSHLQREHGKTIMYLRAKGIKPAPSGSWAF